MERNIDAVIDSIAGIPAHPLFVHIPVVLLPLAAILAIVWALVPRWRRALGPVTVVLAALGAAGAVLARSTGEALLQAKGFTEDNPGPVAEHAQWSLYATIAGIALFVLVALMLWLGRRAAGARGAAGRAAVGARSSAGHIAVRVLTVIAAVAVILATVETGHEGAKLTWNDKGEEQSAPAQPGDHPPADADRD